MGRRLFYGCSFLFFIVAILGLIWVGRERPSTCPGMERPPLHYLSSEKERGVSSCQEQRREGVLKDFWFPDGQKGANIVLKAEQSALYLDEPSTLVEWMEPIQGTVDYGQTTVGYQAPRALFYYSEKKIVADEMSVEGTFKNTNEPWSGKIETIDVLLEPVLQLTGTGMNVGGEKWKAFFEHITFTADVYVWTGKGYQITYGDHALSSAQGTASWKQGGEEINLESPYQGEQILFHDPMGDILADRAILRLKEVEGTVMLDQVELQGHIRLRNLFAASDVIPVPFEQFGLADRLTFYPATLEMQLKAAPKEKVVFIDQEHGIQMSATGLSLKRGEKEPEIKGDGRVSLKLTSKEFDRIQQVIQHFKKGTK